MSEGLTQGPIGVFDSGYGGLTVFREILDELPDYDYIYLGDNARTPYGTRSLDTVYEFTLQGVRHLFAQGCHLVILACNTASCQRSEENPASRSAQGNLREKSIGRDKADNGTTS